jgi:hypothetical protein
MVGLKLMKLWIMVRVMVNLGIMVQVGLRLVGDEVWVCLMAYIDYG